MCVVEVVCNISEMQICVKFDFDGIGQQKLVIGVLFFDYMFDQIV